MILITGATGYLGNAVVEQLSKQIDLQQFAVLARNGQKAKSLKQKGIAVRLADYDDVDTLDSALKGVNKVLLIPSIAPNRLQQNKNVIDAAVKNGVKQIVYTGVSFKNVETSETLGLEAHFQTEDYILHSGLAYTFLRNTLYTDGLPMFLGETVFDKGIYLPAGDGKVPYALRREMGEAAGNVLLQDGHENKTYEITGNHLYSYTDVANALGQLSGKTVTYTAADPEAFSEQLKAIGLDEFTIFVLKGFNVDIKNKQYETVTSDLEKLLGRKPADLKSAIKEIFNL